MIPGIAAAATSEVSAAAARATLAAGGGAVDALIAGFFAAAGADPAVLFAPAIALVAGAGMGARAFDGRAVQAGKGAARPRGFVPGDAIPAAARVAVPRSIAMLALFGYRGRSKFSELVRPGVVQAKERSADRARLLDKIGNQGPMALRAPEVERALLAAGGAVSGGLMTADDLRDLRPDDVEASLLARDGARILTPPWPAGEGRADSDNTAEAIVAVDHRGVVAALAYAPCRGGIPVDSLDVLLGLQGTPILRGVRRVSPGTPIQMPAPVAIVLRDALSTSVGVPRRATLIAEDLADVAAGLSIDPAIRAMGSGVIAVVGDGDRARVIDTAD